MIIRLSSLGDVVLSTVVLDALQEAFPNTERWVLTKPSYASLFDVDTRLTGILQWEQGTFWKQVERIRGMDFDAVLDLHATPRSRALSAVLFPRKRVRYRKQWLARMSLVQAKWLWASTRRTVDLYLDALTGLGIRERSSMPKLFVDPAARQQVCDCLRAEGIGEEERLIGIHPGARWPTKQWRAEGFAEVCDRMIEKERHVILLGGTGDQTGVRHIIEQMKSQPTVWVGALDLQGLMATIERCDVLLSNDSGPMHIGTAVGTPVVGLFGPTHPKLGFAPVGEQDRAITADVPCSPCSLHGEKPCTLPQQRCMDAISPEQVVKALESALVRVS